jgi:hypothetical protein
VWLNRDELVVGFNTSPNCRQFPDRKVAGSARLLAFDASGEFKVERDIPYLADGNGELVAQGEARPGPGGSLLFRIESVNLDEDGSHQSESGVLLIDGRLKEVGHLDRFLEQTTFVNHALVFQEGFTLGNTRAYSIFDKIPPVETRRVEMSWPVDARDRRFGEQGLAYVSCEQELRQNVHVSTPVIYAGAKQSCKMTVLKADGSSWTSSLANNEGASVIGLLSDGSVLGNLHVKGSSAGQLVLWKEGKPVERLPWIPDRYCGSIESATAGITRYGAYASENCDEASGLLEILGVEQKTTNTPRWMIFDRKSKTAIVDRPLPKNSRAAMSPDGLRYATFESGELRVYKLPM